MLDTNRKISFESDFIALSVHVPVKVVVFKTVKYLYIARSDTIEVTKKVTYFVNEQLEHLLALEFSMQVRQDESHW